MSLGEIPIATPDLDSHVNMEPVQRNILLKRGGGKQPKYSHDNIRTQYLHLNKDNQHLDIWDTSYAKYMIDLEIIEVHVEWNTPVAYDDLRIFVDFPSRTRPLQMYQPEARNTVVIFTEPIAQLDDVTTKSFQNTEDRPQIEVKNPEEQSGIRKLVLDVRSSDNSVNTIDDWDMLVKIKYIDESQ